MFGNNHSSFFQSNSGMNPMMQHTNINIPVPSSSVSVTPTSINHLPTGSIVYVGPGPTIGGSVQLPNGPSVGASVNVGSNPGVGGSVTMSFGK